MVEATVVVEMAAVVMVAAMGVAVMVVAVMAEVTGEAAMEAEAMAAETAAVVTVVVVMVAETEVAMEVAKAVVAMEAETAGCPRPHPHSNARHTGGEPPHSSRSARYCPKPPGAARQLDPERTPPTATPARRPDRSR